MATPSRSSKLTKVHKVLKKHYKPDSANSHRQVLEQLLFACCLEDAPAAAAEKAFSALSDTFFDWNEVRVSSLKELAEVLKALPDPMAAANRLKRVLQSIFETTYSFDMEYLRKENLGKAIARLKKIDGTTPFTAAYVVQHSLGGHAIPVSGGGFGAFKVLQIVSESEAAAEHVPGLERAIAKSKGHEFSSLLQQFGADFASNPYAPALHKILLEIDPAAKERLPRRPTRKERQQAEEAQQQRDPSSPAPPKGSKKKAASKDGSAARSRDAAKTKADSRAKPAARKKTSPAATPKKKKPTTATKRTHASGLRRRKPR